MRIISHQIDLIPRSSLPNKAPHIMTPAENEELNRQVHELLERGLIKDIPSPCELLVVLELNRGGEWRMCIDSRDINRITIK